MNTAALIDEFAALDAQIKALESRKAALRQTLIETLEPGAHEGLLSTLSITQSERSTTDWKAIASKLKPSHQLVAAHTKVAEVITVRASVRAAAPAVPQIQLVA